MTTTEAVALACYECDREHWRTLQEAVDAGWKEVSEAVSDPDDVLDWYTHIGWCPSCGVPVVEQLEMF